jgi:hypothetical protein
VLPSPADPITVQLSSPGIRVTLSGKGFALALQLQQTSTDSGKIVGSADRHRFPP